jgi:hypothetical protein
MLLRRATSSDAAAIAVAFSDGAGNEENEPDVLYAWAGRT